MILRLLLDRPVCLTVSEELLRSRVGFEAPAKSARPKRRENNAPQRP